ncbi:MAG: hypothetical protein ABIQ05_06760 [Candidatus Limnocylindria bacterium]
MIDRIPPQTYAVLDLPEPVAGRVMEIRRKHRDDFRSALPAEVTVVGSSGVGCFAEGQPAHNVFATLDRIAATTQPIRTSLDGVIRFPNTDIFAFGFTDEAGLRNLHRRPVSRGSPSTTTLGRSSLTSLCGRVPPSPMKTPRASPTSASRTSSTLDQLSMYQLDEDPAGQAPVICKLLHRSRLGTSAPPGMKRRTTLLP